MYLGIDGIIFTRPNPSRFGQDPYKIKLPEAEFIDLVVTGTFNGVPIGDIFPIIDTTTTGDATPTTLSTIATTTDSAYVITSNVVAVSTAGDSLNIKQSCKVNNIGGVLSALTIFDTSIVSDAALATASVSFIASGTNILVQITGVALTDINWKGYREVRFVTY